MTHRRGGGFSRRGAGAAGALIVACGTLGASVAGANGSDDRTGATSQLADVTIGVDETNGQFFKPADVTVDTGDTVTWNFDGSQSVHNAASEKEEADDPPSWKEFATPFVRSGQFSYRFTEPGTYRYLCEAHPEEMRGTVTVTGAPVATPTPSATATPTPTATATATPSPVGPQATPTPTPPSGNNPPNQPPADDHTNTPPPTRIAGPRADRTAPAISSLRLRGVTSGARVSFRLSESASVTLSIAKRGSRKVLRTVRLQARAGSRTVTLRSSRLVRGTYTVSVQARDAMGNRSRLTRANVRVSR